MKNPLVVGYKGEIGSFILQGLLKHLPKATNIWCVDINDTHYDIVERITKSDIIFLCVPLEETVPFLLKYETLLYKKIIIEQTSLKRVVFADKRLKKLWPNIWSVHILFRPSGTPKKEDRVIAYIEKDPKSGSWSRNLLDVTQLFTFGCEIPRSYLFSNWRQHDKEMALQQALVHRVLVQLNNIISSKDGHLRHTFMGKRVNELANRILAGDLELYRAIQANPYTERAVNKFKRSLKNAGF